MAIKGGAGISPPQKTKNNVILVNNAIFLGLLG